MPRTVTTLAAGSLLTALLVGCSLTSPDQLAGTPALTADTHLTLLQTTDIHDHAAGDGPMSAGVPGPIGSYARIAGYVDSVRTSATPDRPVVLVDSGDFFMGTLYDLTAAQQPLGTFFLDTLRYDCATLGNHEFDYTPAGLASILKMSHSSFGFHTPIVASNMVLNGNLDLAPYMGTTILPTYTKTLPTGLKVGFIGLMGKDAAADAPASAPVSFTDYSTNYGAIQTLVDGLRNAQGCNVVIALSHAGTDASTGGYTGEDINLAKKVTGIDVIASGHTHNAFPDASAAHAVTNGSWTTQVICGGCYSANVARIDLTYHFSAKNTTVDASSNKSMTDAVLTPLPNYLGKDTAASVFVGQADAALNFSLGSLFTQFFPDYNASDLSKGLYHPVGVAAQDMYPNDINPVLSPNGLGNLCADSIRNVPNAIISKALLGAGWNGDYASATLATAAGRLTALGYDVSPYTVGVVPTGVIRDYLAGGSAISFANVYDVLPLGISPDTTQALPVGYPLMSVYLTYQDLQKLCGLQLLSQTNLTPSTDYLNMSGLSYALDATASYTYFKNATAAAVLSVTNAKATSGGTTAAVTQAQKALTDLGSLAKDSGAALMGDMGTNPYAMAMVALNDPAATLTPAQIGANLQTLGTIATMAATDAGMHTATLNTKIFTLATAAIGQVSAFSSLDPSCKGTAAALDSTKRYRVAGDLYAILMMGAVQSQFGVSITAYAAPTGTATVSGANLTAAMANRINLNGPTATVQELKEWMALVLYMITPPAQGGYFTNGTITSEYLSTPNFTEFGTCGAAVKVRNGTYPIASIGQLMATLQALS